MKKINLLKDSLMVIMGQLTEDDSNRNKESKKIVSEYDRVMRLIKNQ